MVAYRFTINSPGRRWRVLVGRSRLKRGFFGQVDCWTSFSSSSHSLNLFSSRNFSPKLSIFACKLVAIPHIYCSKRKMLESCALKFKRGRPQEALRQSWPGAVAWHQTWTADCGLRTEDYNGDQKCWDLSNDISKTSNTSPPTPQKVEFWAKWVEMSAFSWPQHYWGERGGQRDEPKVDKKLSLGIIFFVYIIMALNVIKFLTEKIQAMAMAKNIALYLQPVTAAMLPYQSTPAPPNPETNDACMFNPPGHFCLFS